MAEMVGRGGLMRAKLDGRSWSETPVPLVTTASYRTGPPLGSPLGLVILLSWPETKAPPISAFEAVIKPLAVMPTQMAALLLHLVLGGILWVRFWVGKSAKSGDQDEVNGDDDGDQGEVNGEDDGDGENIRHLRQLWPWYLNLDIWSLVWRNLTYEGSYHTPGPPISQITSVSQASPIYFPTNFDAISAVCFKVTWDQEINCV